MNSSGTHISYDLTRLHGSAQSSVVSFDLVCVGHREVDDGSVEALALAEVSRDLHAVAGAGVRAGQRPAADACINDKFVGRHALYLRRALHVSQLTPVEVATGWTTE